MKNSLPKADDKTLIKLFKDIYKNCYQSLISLSAKLSPTDFKSKILEKTSNYIQQIIITEDKIPSISLNSRGKEVEIFTLRSTLSGHSLYKNLAKLPLNLEESYSLSGMILFKNQHKIFLKINENEFILEKIYYTEKFDSWDKCFISIVEQSLVPECWVYTKKQLVENVNITTWDRLEKYLYPEQVSNNTSFDSGKSQPSPEKPNSVVQNGKNNKKVVTPVKAVSLSKTSNAIEGSKKNTDPSKGLMLINAYEKKWECEKCKEVNPLNIPTCICNFNNQNLVLSQTTKIENNCKKCSQPSIRDLCRSCLSGTIDKNSTAATPIIPNGYETVSKKPDFNRALRSSSLAPKLNQNSRNSVQVSCNRLMGKKT